MPAFSQETKHPVLAKFFAESRGRTREKLPDHGILGPTSAVKWLICTHGDPHPQHSVTFKTQCMGPTCVDFVVYLILHSEHGCVVFYKVICSHVLHLLSFPFPLFPSKSVFSFPLIQTCPKFVFLLLLFL